MTQDYTSASSPVPELDADVDVVVLGTGCAGLVAALAAAEAGARVAVYEKSDKIGGTTALSGGVLWLPDNPLARAQGIADSRTDAVAYLESLSNGMILPELAAAFIDGVEASVSWVEAASALRLRLINGFPDYHPEHPGGRPGGGRSCEPELFSMKRLGPWHAKVAGDVRRTQNRESPLGGGTGILEPAVEAERAATGAEAAGRALVGALLASLLDRGIEPSLSTRATRLIVDGDSVVGVELSGDAGPLRVRARAVVLATGGFEYDDALVRDFLRGPMGSPPGVPSNTGDGLRMAMRVGARLGNMREAWWVPVVRLAGLREDGGNRTLLLLRERTLPRSIMVNAAGRRFTNEAVNYNALGSALHELDPVRFDYANQPCWLVFDQGFVDAYGGFGLAPGGPMPDWVTCADTLSDLASLVGTSPDALEATVSRWNELVDRGHDDDFLRGDSAYDSWCGDRSVPPGPAATMGRIDAGPYYAVEVVSSALGTKGGPRTTADGAVLHVDGHVIPGLFAAGNVAAGPTGMVYGGAGGTLGPALVFGRLAGVAAAAEAHKKELEHVS